MKMLLACFLVFLMSLTEVQAGFLYWFPWQQETKASQDLSSKCELICSKSDWPFFETEQKYRTTEMGGTTGQARANFLRFSDRLTGVPYLTCQDRVRFCLKFIDGRVYRGGKLLAKTPFYRKKDLLTNYIYVMDAVGNFFAATRKEVLHHSAFLAAGPVAAAGVMQVSDGKILMLSNESGHYQPSGEFLRQAMVELDKQGIRGFEVNEKL